MDIMTELLKHAMRQSDREKHAFKSRMAATEALRKYIDMPSADFKIGDFVERNEAGEQKYTMPRANEAAIITRILPADHRDKDGDPDDYEICVVIGDGLFKHFTVDSRYYRKVNAEKSNVFGFRKK